MKCNGNILLVDDDQGMLNSMSMILKRNGYNVETAADGIAAVEKYSCRYFDVTLMDMVMPRMDGIEAFKRIRDIDSAATVILMTAFYEEREIGAVLEEGARCALHKPLDIPQLIDLLSRSTGNPSVLIVDDNPEFRKTLARAFEIQGHRVCAASSGEEAVDMARKRRFKLAFIDVSLPFMDGLDTFLQLKKLSPGVSAVMMTGHRVELAGRVQMALSASAAACLYKPFSPDVALAFAAKGKHGLFC